MTDPYQILGVSRDASDDEIKKAYRTLSRKYHPDANINNPNKDQAEAKFKEVQQAYQQIMKEREYGSSGSYEQAVTVLPADTEATVAVRVGIHSEALAVSVDSGETSAVATDNRPVPKLRITKMSYICVLLPTL